MNFSCEFEKTPEEYKADLADALHEYSLMFKRADGIERAMFELKQVYTIGDQLTPSLAFDVAVDVCVSMSIATAELYNKVLHTKLEDIEKIPDAAAELLFNPNLVEELAGDFFKPSDNARKATSDLVGLDIYRNTILYGVRQITKAMEHQAEDSEEEEDNND